MSTEIDYLQPMLQIYIGSQQISDNYEQHIIQRIFNIFRLIKPNFYNPQLSDTLETFAFQTLDKLDDCQGSAFIYLAEHFVANPPTNDFSKLDQLLQYAVRTIHMNAMNIQYMNYNLIFAIIESFDVIYKLRFSSQQMVKFNTKDYTIPFLTLAFNALDFQQSPLMTHHMIRIIAKCLRIVSKIYQNFTIGDDLVAVIKL